MFLQFLKQGKFFQILFFVISFLPVSGHQIQKVILASKNGARFSINIRENATSTEKFAAEELSKYLNKISGAVFQVQFNKRAFGKTIEISIVHQYKTESYSIKVTNKKIEIKGGSRRSVLYAVYDFLERLGCRWIAPSLSFYLDGGEFIPHTKELCFQNNFSLYESPQFIYRKLNVEEGLSHDLDNLREIVNWMPKLRFNILMIPLNYGGNGRVMWDNWREELTPELKKRGLLIEVGGHGYQNFLNAEMESGTLFKMHPEWFGLNKDCKPDSAKNIVFNTSNKNAVEYLTSNVLSYISNHPEIDILDFWPPDGAHWNDCVNWKAMGDPLDRQANLVNHVDSVVKLKHPDVTLEMIAYQPVLLPPKVVSLSKDILVDFCPINQSFEYQIYDTASLNNSEYVKSINLWRQSFPGKIGLYSYFRKYAWHSLPNVNPHFIQKDLNWYAALPLQGISTYAEPGDWFTYELNYYVLGHLAWSPKLDVDSLLSQYYKVRFGTYSKEAEAAYTTLEDVVALYCTIPFTKRKTASEINKAKGRVHSQILQVQKVATVGSAWKNNFSRLLLMLEYAYYDLKVQEMIAVNESDEKIETQLKEILNFLQINKDKGVFIMPAQNELKWMMKHYKF